VEVWPQSRAELVSAQRELARREERAWRPPAGAFRAAGCYVCFARGGPGAGRTGEPGWAAAALMLGSGRRLGTAVVRGLAGAAYEPGLLALREGPLLEAAVRALSEPPEVVIANATGRDHPRDAGLARHLGAVLGIPSIGVTDRPLLAEGSPPGEERGSISPLFIDDWPVACWVRTRSRARPVVVHPGWRTDLDSAVAVVRKATRRARTPEPLRRARRAAREARAGREHAGA
jgi:deoxyribonuclease V